MKDAPPLCLHLVSRHPQKPIRVPHPHHHPSTALQRTTTYGALNNGLRHRFLIRLWIELDISLSRFFSSSLHCAVHYCQQNWLGRRFIVGHLIVSIGWVDGQTEKEHEDKLTDCVINRNFLVLWILINSMPSIWVFLFLILTNFQTYPRPRSSPPPWPRQRHLRHRPGHRLSMEIPSMVSNRFGSGQ